MTVAEVCWKMSISEAYTCHPRSALLMLPAPMTYTRELVQRARAVLGRL